MSERITSHHTSTVFTEAEAKQRLEALNAEVNELVKCYGLHSMIFVASASVPPTGESKEPDAMATSVIEGCHEHGLAFLARFLTFMLDQKRMANFLDFLLKAQDLRNQMGHAVDHAKNPMVEAEKQLERMPSPGGKVWKN